MCGEVRRGDRLESAGTEPGEVSQGAGLPLGDIHRTSRPGQAPEGSGTQLTVLLSSHKGECQATKERLGG